MMHAAQAGFACRLPTIEGAAAHNAHRPLLQWQCLPVSGQLRRQLTLSSRCFWRLACSSGLRSWASALPLQQHAMLGTLGPTWTPQKLLSNN